MWYLNKLSDAYQRCQKCPLSSRGLSLKVVKLIKMRMDTVKSNKEVLGGFCHLFEFSEEVFSLHM